MIPFSRSWSFSILVVFCLCVLTLPVRSGSHNYTILVKSDYSAECTTTIQSSSTSISIPAKSFGRFNVPEGATNVRLQCSGVLPVVDLKWSQMRDHHCIQLYYFTILQTYKNITCTYTQIPTTSPTHNPTERPSMQPTKSPTTHKPTNYPGQPAISTATPSSFPTQIPTTLPTSTPTKVPTKSPTKLPTNLPTTLSTHLPTELSTNLPTNSPTRSLTGTPITPSPTVAPVVQRFTKQPTDQPVSVPPMATTVAPTSLPTLPSQSWTTTGQNGEQQSNHSKTSEMNSIIVLATISFVTVVLAGCAGISLAYCCYLRRTKKRKMATLEIDQGKSKHELFDKSQTSMDGKTPVPNPSKVAVIELIEGNEGDFETGARKSEISVIDNKENQSLGGLLRDVVAVNDALENDLLHEINNNGRTPAGEGI